MTILETGKVLDIIKTAYPEWKATPATVALWADLFADDPAAQVLAAVKSFIAQDTKGFAPSIGQVKAIMAEAEEDENSLTEAEARVYFTKAVSNGIYGSVTEFNALPPILQRVVGSPEQIEQWAMLTDGLYTVVLSQYLRAFRAELQREKQNKTVPKKVREALTGVTADLFGRSLPGGEKGGTK